MLLSESVGYAGQTGYLTKYEYNDEAQRSSTTYPPDNHRVDYAPNALGQPTKVGPYATFIAYHPNGAVDTFQYGNGITHTATQDNQGRVKRSTDKYGTQAALLDFELGYDLNGNVDTITDHRSGGLDSVSMTYDQVNRLESAMASGIWGSASYGYNQYDNLQSTVIGGVTTAFGYDAVSNRLTTLTSGSSTTTLQYDAPGNVTSKGDQYSAAFDLAGKLRQGTDLHGGALYDARGTRFSTDGSGDCTPPGGTGIHACLGPSEKTAHDSAGKLTLVEHSPSPGAVHAPHWRAQYFRLGGVLIAKRQRTWGSNYATGPYDFTSVNYIHTDQLGSVVATTDEAGTVWESERYLPYGQPADGDADGPSYAGHYADSSGLVYMGARYYDPAIGRFISPDPVGLNMVTGANLNRYWYANNNPYTFVDEDGRFAVVGALLGAGIEVGLQIFYDGRSITNLDGTDVLVAAAVGSVTSGVGGRVAVAAARRTISASTATLYAAAAGSLASGFGSMAEDVLNQDPVDYTKAGISFTVGGATAGLSERLALGRVARLESMSSARVTTPAGIAATISQTSEALQTGGRAAVLQAAGATASSRTSRTAGRLIDLGASSVERTNDDEVPRN
jgi:RHS repeat-associated protein